MGVRSEDSRYLEEVLERISLYSLLKLLLAVGSSYLFLLLCYYKFSQADKVPVVYPAKQIGSGQEKYSRQIHVLLLFYVCLFLSHSFIYILAHN